MIDYQNMTIKELKDIAQPKSLDETGYFILARKMSFYVTRVLLHTSITANQVSILFLFFSILAALFLFVGLRYENYYYFIGVPVFIWIYIVLDCTDGEIARLKGTSHPMAGKVMDVFCHEIFDNAVVVAVTLAMYLKSMNTLPLIIGLLLMVGKSIDRRLHGTIVRSVRLYEARHNVKMVKPKDSKKPSEQKKRNVVLLAAEYIPYKGVFLLVLFSMLGEKILLSYFMLWAIKFNVKFVYDARRFFKSPETYLK